MTFLKPLGVAAIVAASILAPGVSLAGDPIPGVTVGAGKNPRGEIPEWVDNCKGAGGTVIPAGGNLGYCASAKAVDTCKAKGGKVTFAGSAATCDIPK
jgi:hypothetical protein